MNAIANDINYHYHSVVVILPLKRGSMLIRILLMETDDKLSNELLQALCAQGCAITKCCNSREGVAITIHEDIDLILLDLELTTTENFTCLQQIRAVSQTPVMVFSSSHTTRKRIEAFQQGADDFLAKPLDTTEVLLRVNALLRRTRGVASVSDKVIYIDQLVLNKAKQKVSFSGDDLGLTPIQFRLLWILVKNRYQIMTKAFLYQAVLDRQFSLYDRSLDMHLSRIRKKLIETGMAAERLSTIHGKGYRFS